MNPQYVSMYNNKHTSYDYKESSDGYRLFEKGIAFRIIDLAIC